MARLLGENIFQNDQFCKLISKGSKKIKIDTKLFIEACLIVNLIEPVKKMKKLQQLKFESII